MVFSHQSKTTTSQRQANDKIIVEPVHSYDAFHTRFVGPGVKGVIGMHGFNICLVVVLSWSCSGVKTPLRPCIGNFTYVGPIQMSTAIMPIDTLSWAFLHNCISFPNITLVWDQTM